MTKTNERLIDFSVLMLVMYSFLHLIIDDLSDWGATFAAGVLTTAAILLVVLNALYIVHHLKYKDLVEYVIPLVFGNFAVTILGSLVPYFINLQQGESASWGELAAVYLEPAILIAAIGTFIGLMDKLLRDHAYLLENSTLRRATDLHNLKVTRHIIFQFGALYMATFLLAHLMFVNNDEAMAEVLLYFLPVVLIAASVVAVGELWENDPGEYLVPLAEINFFIALIGGTIPFLGLLAFYDDLSEVAWSLYLQPALAFALVGVFGGMLAAVVKNHIHYDRMKQIRQAKRKKGVDQKGRLKTATI